MRSRTRSGFTLLELLLVLSIMGIVVSMTVPNYLVYRQRALATEATIALETMAHLELVSILETGASIACEPAPTAIPADRTPFAATETWQRLGFAPQGMVRYQYEIEKTGQAGFVARARADLDHDGLVGEYWLDGRDLELRSSNPGE
ncbi:MAG: prepilin-type N-terminal cleavage/methylation domain-containing protein [Deltaproteobacteria bacterium]|nr:prepilin-type N-terminal cleavage/methylation domain-containing protein [Deltaproteobacteria bacterium]